MKRGEHCSQKEENIVQNRRILLKRGEYASGHINGSINIPVDELANQLNKLKDKNKTIITCCASGMRSGSAKNILESKGYTSIYNGGGWFGLNVKLQ